MIKENSTANIVDYTSLVKSNGINTLNTHYKSKFIDRVKNDFTIEEQGLLFASFHIYLHFHPTKDYPVNLDNVYKWIGFCHKRNAKRTLVNNFVEGEDFKVNVRHKEHGKFAEEEILLNVDTFKNLCMITKTEQSKKIRRYYIKLEHTQIELLEEQRKEYEDRLLYSDLALARAIEDTQMQKHNFLLREYGSSKSIVYIIKVKTISEGDNQPIDDKYNCKSGKFVIKIGESRLGISNRYKEHRSKYPECAILDCFSVKRSKDFESFLHQQLSNYRYKDLVGHENEKELFLVGEELSYAQVCKIVEDNIGKYNDDELAVQKLQLEIEKLKLELQTAYSKNGVVNDADDLRQQVSDLKSFMQQEFDKVHVKLQLKSTNNFCENLQNVGPKIQQINPETFNLVKVYDSIAEVSKTFRIPRSSLVKAIKENTVYKNFRWAFIDRDCVDDTKVDIQPTRELKKHQNNGYIAKVTSDKSKIVAVYLDRKTASMMNNYASVAFLDSYVKECKIVDNHFYLLYDACDEQSKKDFIKSTGGEEIVLYKTGVGQFDENGNMVAEFRSKHECGNLCSIGRKTLDKALMTGKAYSGYFYRDLREKLCVTNQKI